MSAWIYQDLKLYWNHKFWAEAQKLMSGLQNILYLGACYNSQFKIVNFISIEIQKQ